MVRALVGGVVIGLAACGTAHVVARDARSGTLELRGDRTSAMEKANETMSAQCGVNNYTIRKEGYEPVEGSEVWRVHFECNASSLPPPAPPPEPPAEPAPPPMPVAGVPSLQAGSGSAAGSGSGSGSGSSAGSGSGQ